MLIQTKSWEGREHKTEYKTTEIDHYHSDSKPGRIELLLGANNCCYVINLNPKNGGGMYLHKHFNPTKPIFEMSDDELRDAFAKMLVVYDKRRNMTDEECDEEERQQAIKDDPTGVICYRCGGPNDFYDDCGWFNANIDRSIDGRPEKRTQNAEYRPICRNCSRELGCDYGDR